MTDLAITVNKLIKERVAQGLSPLPILYEDNHLLCVLKYPFVLSQKDGTSKLDVLSLEKEYIREMSIQKGRAKLGNIYLSACHRLDYTVGGVLLLAKTDKAASRLQIAFSKGQIKKRYIAITVANEEALSKLAPYSLALEKSLFMPARKTIGPQGQTMPITEDSKIYRLQNYLLKDQVKLQAKVWQGDASKQKVQENYKKAALQMRFLAKHLNAFIFEIALETGRFHQIRAQLATANLPLLGDYKYNLQKEQKEAFTQPLLWSYSLQFVHPVKKTNLCFNAWPEKFCFAEFANFPYADYLL